MSEAERIDLESVPADEKQKLYWKEIFAKERIALVRKAELENAAEKFTAEKGKVQAKLKSLEEALPDKMLLWVTGHKAYRFIVEARQKISELRNELADMDEGLRVIQKAIAHETKVPISHGSTTRDQIRYLLEKKAKKAAG